MMGNLEDINDYAYVQKWLRKSHSAKLLCKIPLYENEEKHCKKDSFASVSSFSDSDVDLIATLPPIIWSDVIHWAFWVQDVSLPKEWIKSRNGFAPYPQNNALLRGCLWGKCQSPWEFREILIHISRTWIPSAWLVGGGFVLGGGCQQTQDDWPIVGPS